MIPDFLKEEDAFQRRILPCHPNGFQGVLAVSEIFLWSKERNREKRSRQATPSIAKLSLADGGLIISLNGKPLDTLIYSENNFPFEQKTVFTPGQSGKTPQFSVK